MPKTIAVIGITGTQGGSVADTFLSLPDWKVRGISRDPSKDSAKAWSDKGVEMVAGDMDNVDSLKKAFANVDVVFAVTDFWEHMKQPSTHERAAKEGRTPNEVCYDRELEQGKNIIDAVAANLSTLDRFVLSTVSNAKKWSKGKITFNLHFDSKAAMVDYLKETYPELAQKTSYVHLGAYASNWQMPGTTPVKQEDGTFKMSFVLGPDSKVPFVDARNDAGPCVSALLAMPPTKTLMATGSLISYKAFWDIWAKHVGVTCVYEQIDRKFMDEGMGPVGKELADMWMYIDEFGYDGGDPEVLYPWDEEVKKAVGGEVKVTSMEEYIKKQDWSSLL